MIAMLALATLTTSIRADVVVNDSFADNDRAKTGALDTNWYGTNNTSPFEGPPLTGNQLRMATGTSGRGIHTLFSVQSLSAIGDKITATYTFTTPATIGSTTSSFRVGLFNPDSSSNPSELAGDLSVSSGNPNPAVDLNGYMFDMDVSPASSPNAASDIQFRKQDQAVPTGRLMGTTSGFNGLGSSGPDGGYAFAPDTSYTGSFSIERTSATDLTLAAAIGAYSYSVVDDGVALGSVYPNFGFFGVHINSNTFGSTNDSALADSGIAFTNVTVDFTSAAVPEPGSAALLLGGLVSLGFVRRRK
jgi:hypothetical protein